jgi:hypothetical protein
MVANSLVFPHKKQLISQGTRLAYIILCPMFKSLCRHVDSFLGLRLKLTQIFVQLQNVYAEVPPQLRHLTLVSVALTRHLSCGSIRFLVFIVLLSLAFPENFLLLWILTFYNATRQLNTTNTITHRTQSFHSSSSSNHVSIKII